MKMEQVSDNCFAVLIEKNRVCDANSGLINRAGGVVIDTQSDLAHGRQMIELFSKVWPAMPKRVINTHEDGDHVWGNQLFEGAEIIARRALGYGRDFRRHLPGSEGERDRGRILIPLRNNKGAPR